MRPVVFDFDGVLVDTELIWTDVRRRLTEEHGGTWPEDGDSQLQGLSTREWAERMVEVFGVALDPDDLARRVVARMVEQLEHEPPFLPGALETVRRLAGDGRRLGVASSSPRDLLATCLASGGIRPCFTAVVSSEEVERGKPSPDVYLEAAHRLGVTAEECVAVEDSANGLRAAAAAGMELWAVPNPHDPPGDDALALAARTGGSVAELFSPA